jgi:hypothetical protein
MPRIRHVWTCVCRNIFRLETFFVDIQITNSQNVDIQIVDTKNVDTTYQPM